jgi:hypothetical protein
MRKKPTRRCKCIYKKEIKCCLEINAKLVQKVRLHAKTTKIAESLRNRPSYNLYSKRCQSEENKIDGQIQTKRSGTWSLMSTRSVRVH